MTDLTLNLDGVRQHTIYVTSSGTCRDLRSRRAGRDVGWHEVVDVLVDVSVFAPCQHVTLIGRGRIGEMHERDAVVSYGVDTIGAAL